MMYNGSNAATAPGVYPPLQPNDQHEPMDYSPQPSAPISSLSYSPQSSHMYTNPHETSYPSTFAGYRYPEPAAFSPPQEGVGMYSPASMASELLGNPALSSVAMQYGSKIGKDIVDKEIGKYVAPYKLKHYFAVDTAYVLNKLKLLVFPFTHSDWSQKYDKNQPLQPRHDVNKPDLYIPAMAYITYILIAGLVLGVQDRFTPETLGIIASQALAWIIIEIVLELAALYIMNIPTRLMTWDLVSFAGYKFVSIILAVIIGLLCGQIGYFVSLIYLGLSLAFFLVRTMKWMMLVENANNLDSGYSTPSSNVYFNTGHKRRLYFLLAIAATQPFLMWWLSYHLQPIA